MRIVFDGSSLKQGSELERLSLGHHLAVAGQRHGCRRALSENSG